MKFINAVAIARAGCGILAISSIITLIVSVHALNEFLDYIKLAMYIFQIGGFISLFLFFHVWHRKMTQ